MTGSDAAGLEPVAIVGMACRVPGATTVGQFWRNMRDGVESVTRFGRGELPAEADDPDYVPASGYLDGADEFDAAFFGFNPAEAETLDPQHRLFFETVWAAVEDSGHDPGGFGGDVGVFAGCFMNKYLAGNLAASGRFQRSPMAALARTFNDKDFLATRVAFLLNLTGPAYTIQTACSTSLVATHLACQSLLSYECDAALVGGACLNLPLKSGYLVPDRGVFSMAGHCRPFDAQADGTVPGNGSVALVLRRLSDATADGDHIYAVIRASAVNNDGLAKAGFAAPSVGGQARVIAAALALAGVDPATIGYVEAHGTATQVGDVIEVTALAQALGPRGAGTGRCALGSVKGNIGHLDAAAGVAGLMRAALAIYHGQIPPNANFTAPNPELGLGETPFFVPAVARDWHPAEGPRRAGVSSFGVGGTNAHVVLEQAPDRQPATQSGRQWQLLPISARTKAATDAATAQLGTFLSQPDLGTRLSDVAFTLQDGRKLLAVRRFVVCTDSADAVAALHGQDPSRLVTRIATGDAREVVFAFPGAGMQHHDMGLDIYRSEPVFRDEVDRCARVLLPDLGYDLRRLLFPSAFEPLPDSGPVRRSATMGRGREPGVACALFTVEYALARQLMAWGIRPTAMIGHSLGEYVAACLAGVFTLPGALRLTLARGELFTQMQPGRMLVVQMPEAALAPMLPARISVSAVNAPDLTVVAGPDSDISALLAKLRADGIDCRMVSVPVASHSWLVDPFLADFSATVKEQRLGPPEIPFVSGVTGTWITAEEAADPGYWARHLRQPVRFADGIAEVLAAPGRVLLEVGPGKALTSLAGSQRLAPAPVTISTMGLPRDSLPDLANLVTAVGKLWQHGIAIDWRAFHRPAEPRRIPLPGYPFERRRFWVEPDPAGARPDPVPDPAPVWQTADTGESPADDTGPRTARERAVAGVWCALLGIGRVDMADDFFALGGNSLMVTQMARELRKMGARQITGRDVLAAPTVPEMAALVDQALGTATRIPPRPALRLEDEAVLQPEIRADGLPEPDSREPGHVLLTGATGFVGAFLCSELLSRPDTTVTCLVRAADAAQGAARVRAALGAYGLPVGPARLEVITGDLAQPLLGLRQADFLDLAGQLDAIYHCGAWVNFVRPYWALKPANVLGTQEVLRLATQRRLKPVHHISTLAVLAGAMADGRVSIGEDDPLPPPVGHDTAYSQSKWVAEKIIGLARSRGIPVSVYRAGVVLSDSRSGATNTEDYLTKVVQGCVQLGLAPLREYLLSAVTADHLARLIVALSLRPAQLGRTFHVVDPEPLPWNRIFDEVRRFGYPVRSVPFGEWRQAVINRVDADGDDNAVAALMGMLSDTADRPMPALSCANVLAGLPPAITAAPELDPAFFGRMLGFLARAQMLPSAGAVMTS
jgi:phthiocerol/phenolphthiocerol synthesis type-I polyketide synthase E